MKKIFLICCVFSVMLFSCSKSEHLTPSGEERNWLVIHDDSPDEVDKLRYRVFQETGIPIYYNDTIGSCTRYDKSGPYTHYEILQAFYNPGAVKPMKARYVLADDKNDLIPIINYINENIIPVIPKNMYIASILLVDSLFVPTDTLVHKGLNTIVVGEATRFPKKNDKDKLSMKGSILRSMVSSHILSNDDEWLEEKFYKLTYDVNKKAPLGIYSVNITKRILLRRAWEGFLPEVPQEEMTMTGLGFLKDVCKKWNEPHNQSGCGTLARYEDINQYCEALFVYSKAELDEKYAGEKVILAKLEAMRGKLIEYGFELN